MPVTSSGLTAVRKTDGTKCGQAGQQRRCSPAGANAERYVPHPSNCMGGDDPREMKTRVRKDPLPSSRSSFVRDAPNRKQPECRVKCTEHHLGGGGSHKCGAP